jgi:hypothetical protein
VKARLDRITAGPEELLAALVEVQVDGAAREVARELFVFLFALLPPCGDDGDVALDAGVFDGVGSKRWAPRSTAVELGIESKDWSDRPG